MGRTYRNWWFAKLTNGDTVFLQDHGDLPKFLDHPNADFVKCYRIDSITRFNTEHWENYLRDYEACEIFVNKLNILYYWSLEVEV